MYILVLHIELCKFHHKTSKIPNMRHNWFRYEVAAAAAARNETDICKSVGLKLFNHWTILRSSNSCCQTFSKVILPLAFWQDVTPRSKWWPSSCWSSRRKGCQSDLLIEAQTAPRLTDWRLTWTSSFKAREKPGQQKIKEL